VVELLAEDLVLCPVVLDHLLLLPVHPAGNGHDDEMERFPSHGEKRIGRAATRQGPDGNLEVDQPPPRGIHDRLEERLWNRAGQRPLLSKIILAWRERRTV
jgi:hypothetical protein